MALTLGVGLTTGVSNLYFSLEPVGTAGLTFDLGEHFSLEPWVGLSALYLSDFVIRASSFSSLARIGIRPTFHPTKFLDLGFNSFIGFTQYEAEVNVLAHATVRL